jgi:hypothetical protein
MQQKRLSLIVRARNWVHDRRAVTTQLADSAPIVEVFRGVYDALGLGSFDAALAAEQRAQRRERLREWGSFWIKAATLGVAVATLLITIFTR